MSSCEVLMSVYEVRGQFQGMCDLPVGVMMNMHEVKGLDMMLEVKMQMKVTHALLLTSDLMHTHHDLTAWGHTSK